MNTFSIFGFCFRKVPFNIIIQSKSQSRRLPVQFQYSKWNFSHISHCPYAHCEVKNYFPLWYRQPAVFGNHYLCLLLVWTHCISSFLMRLSQKRAAKIKIFDTSDLINRLTPNDPYMGRTAPLNSKRCILYTYSTNIGTEYFKHALYSPFFFSLQNAVCFIMLTCLVHVLFTFYIQGVVKLKKK